MAVTPLWNPKAPNTWSPERGPIPSGPVVNVGRGQCAAVLANLPGNPGHITSDGSHEVEHVRAQYKDVVRAATGVALAVAAHDLQIADAAVANQSPQEVQAGQVASPLVGHGDPYAGGLGGGDDRVGLGQRARHRLLDVDALDAGGDAVVEPLGVAGVVVRADADEVQVFGHQHLAMVRVGSPRTALGRSQRVRPSVRIGQRNNLDLRQPDPGQVDAVSVGARVRAVADDANPILRHARGPHLRTAA